MTAQAKSALGVLPSMPARFASLWPALLLGAAGACGPRPPAASTPSHAPPPSAAPAPAASATSPAAPAASAAPGATGVGPLGERCGALECGRFATPEAAFEAVLAERPLVLAIGETHAQAGTEGIPSSTARFTSALLPLLGGRASDLVLELWVADGSCGQRETRVAEVQKPVTEPQRETNQNEFVLLGQRASELGVRPHVLRPSCADYDRVVAAGADGVTEMLALIARETEALIAATLRRNREQGIERVVVAYGGAMHNDLVPREGREAYSFGPSVSAHTGDRYVELDLIVPEFIGDSAAWRSLPWYAHFDPRAHPEQVTLLRVRPRSYVLVFARTLTPPAAAPR